MRNTFVKDVYPLEAAGDGIIMPTVLRIGRYRYFFFSNETQEPRHVHVESQDGYSKFWLDPIGVADAVGFSAKELNQIRRQIIDHGEFFKEQWDAYFSRKI